MFLRPFTGAISERIATFFHIQCSIFCEIMDLIFNGTCYLIRFACTVFRIQKIFLPFRSQQLCNYLQLFYFLFVRKKDICLPLPFHKILKSRSSSEHMALSNNSGLSFYIVGIYVRKKVRASMIVFGGHNVFGQGHDCALRTAKSYFFRQTKIFANKR